MAIREYNGNINKYRAYFKYQNKQYSKTFKTRKEAHKWEIETKEALKSEDFTSPKLTYLIASNEYLDDYQTRFQHNSYREKKCHLSEFYRYLENDVELKEIDTHTCKVFILNTKKTLGSKSANRRLKSLKALWNWNKSRINSNPWLGINPYYEDEYKKYVPKKEDVHKVLDVANEWEKDLLYMLIYSGARLSEIFNLRWDDVSLEAGSLQLWTRKRKGGSRQSRLIPICPYFNGNTKKTTVRKFRKSALCFYK